MQNEKDEKKTSESNDTKQKASDDVARPQWMTRGLFNAIGPIALFLFVAGIIVGYYSHFYVNKDSVRLPFWVSVMFSCVAFVVLVVQVVIIAQQAEFMKQQSKALDDGLGRTDTIIHNMREQLAEMKTQNERLNESVERERAINNPRLRIAEVTAENFEVGKRPFFVVTIANDGLLAATGVKISMSIEIGDETPMSWINDQLVTIPASGRQHYFIHSSSWLTNEQLDGFENAVPLRVVGFFDYWPVGTTKFCYKYLALQGDFRPPKIPQFVTCDFTPRLNTTLVVQPGHHTLTGNAVILTHGKVVPRDKEGKDEANKAEDSGKE